MRIRPSLSERDVCGSDESTSENARMPPKATTKAAKAAAAADKTTGPTVDEAKTLIAELCSLFYTQGWVGGTGGGISVKAGDGR